MSGILLTGDTSGTLTLAAPAVAGTNTITLPAATGTAALLSQVKILQAVSFTLATSATTTSTVAVSGGSYTSTGASTGLTASITPSSSSNKILVVGSIGGANGNPGAAQCQFLLMRGSTPVGNGTSSGTQPGLITRCYYNDTNTAIPASFSYLDSPATTSSTTYTLNFGTENASYPVYFNRTPNNANSLICPIFASTITLFEVAA